MMTVGEHVSLAGLSQGPLLPGSEMPGMDPQEVFGLGQMMPEPIIPRPAGIIGAISGVALLGGAAAWLIGAGTQSPKTSRAGLVAMGASLGVGALVAGLAAIKKM